MSNEYFEYLGKLDLISKTNLVYGSGDQMGSLDEKKQREKISGMMIRPPLVGHCDTSTRTIQHCSDLPPVMLRPCDTTLAIQFDPGFFVQGDFVGV
jgi:hypothetical protein